MCISTNKTLEYVEIEVIQLHNLSNDYTRSDDHYGCTDSEAWNYDETMTVDNNSCVYSDLFIVDGCPLEVNPLDHEDHSTNYIGDENLDGDNVFIIDNEDNRAAVIADAREYYEGGNTPIIYDYMKCLWEDTIPHIIRYFEIYYKDTDNNWVYIGGVSYPDEGINDAIEFNVNQFLYSQYAQADGFHIKVVWEFQLNNPTFSGDSIFSHSYIANNMPVAETSPEYNAYDNDPARKVETELFFSSENIFPIYYPPIPEDVVEVTEVEVMASCNLQIQSNVNYTEISNTSIPIIFKRVDGILGDVNGDGELNILDIVLTIHHITGYDYPTYDFTDLQLAQGDMNEDGQINVNDIVAMVWEIGGEPIG